MEAMLITEKSKRKIIPANAGFFEIYDLSDKKDGTDLIVCDPVIAWEIETTSYFDANKEFTHSYITTQSITIHGCQSESFVGVRNPDMSITILEDRNFKSLEEAIETAKGEAEALKSLSLKH